MAVDRPFNTKQHIASDGEGVSESIPSGSNVDRLTRANVSLYVQWSGVE